MIQLAPLFPSCCPTRSTAAFPVSFSLLSIRMNTISLLGSNKLYLLARPNTYITATHQHINTSAEAPELHEGRKGRNASCKHVILCSWLVSFVTETALALRQTTSHFLFRLHQQQHTPAPQPHHPANSMLLLPTTPSRPTLLHLSPRPLGPVVPLYRYYYYKICIEVSTLPGFCSSPGTG